MAYVCLMGGNDIAQNTVHRFTIFSAKDSFLIPATANETNNEERQVKLEGMGNIYNCNEAVLEAK